MTTKQATKRTTDLFSDFCMLLASDETLYSRIIVDLDTTPATALETSFNFCQFLLLKSLYPKELIEPSSTIDIVWHEFILHTELYEQFCQRHFGTIIHHRPGSEGHSYERTLELLSQTFGLNIPTGIEV